ncbi:MAG: MarR family transcriptional regulator [Lachnospiraceae bacterium]|nr:MarR family transcriptional regulator [Lachnospiraceae bacterium]
MVIKVEKKEALGFEIRRISNLIGGYVRSEMIKAGFDEITVTHGWILGWLCDNSDRAVYQKDVENKFGMPRSTVANIMKIMEQKGYITRQSDEKDTRLKRVVVTEKGFKTHKETIALIDRVHCEMEEGISDEEKRSLRSITQKMAANMQSRLGNGESPVPR